MMSWLRAIFDRRSRSELLDQIAAQQDCINMLLGKPVQQLARAAYKWARFVEPAMPWQAMEKIKYTKLMLVIFHQHADALRCLDDVEIPEDET